MEAHIQRAAENEGQKSTTLTEQVGTKVPSTKCVLTKISWNFLGANFEKGIFFRLEPHSLCKRNTWSRGWISKQQLLRSLFLLFGWMSAKWRFFARKLCNNSKILPHSSWLLLGWGPICIFHNTMPNSTYRLLIFFYCSTTKVKEHNTQKLPQ